MIRGRHRDDSYGPDNMKVTKPKNSQFLNLNIVSLENSTIFDQNLMIET